MTYDELKAIFENDDLDEFLKFDRVQDKKSSRPDLHAFLLLDSLVPGDDDMISASEHDEFFLSVSPEELAGAATEEQVIDLIRCGVQLNTEFDCLSMFS